MIFWFVFFFLPRFFTGVFYFLTVNRLQCNLSDISWPIRITCHKIFYSEGDPNFINKTL